MLSVALFALLFAARGSGAPKWQYLLGSAFAVLIDHPGLEWVAYFWVAIAMGCFATSKLLDLTKPKASIWLALETGLLRFVPIIPSVVILRIPGLFLLILHGLIYWIVGRYIAARYYRSATRISELILGAAIGTLL